MSPSHRLALLSASLVLAAACADTGQSLAPDRPDLARGPDWQEPPDPDRARDQRLARRFALAMANQEFRAEVFAGIQGSTQREHRLQLQRFLYQNSHRQLARLARQAGERLELTEADLAAAPSMEVYLPVEEHLKRWQGGADILVATAQEDGEIPVAFDLRGQKHLLDPNSPPSTPVLAVQRWEGGDDIPCEASCALGLQVVEPMAPPPPPPPPPPPEDPPADTTSTPAFDPPTIGLFLTGTRFFDDFEGWLKGKPEFEVHILGQKTGTAELVSYQCIGERAGAPYEFNQDDLTWSGNTMMFTGTQLADFTTTHPGQGLRLLVLEDDDGPCEIKVDKDRVTTLFKTVDAIFATMTSGQEVKITSLQKKFAKAKSYFQLVSGLASFFRTNDDLVGTAIEDPIAAGLVLSGATWIVKGANNATTGALRLSLK